jgi:hypothetical protein
MTGSINFLPEHGEMKEVTSTKIFEKTKKE